VNGKQRLVPSDGTIASKDHNSLSSWNHRQNAFEKESNKLTREDHQRAKLCLASPLFFPVYGGSQLRFLRYLPGFRKRGIDVQIVSGTPTAEDVTAGSSAETWSRYAAGEILPEETVNGVPVTRVRLPDNGSLRRSFHYLRTVYRQCKIHRPDVLQLFGTLRYNALPWLWRLRGMGISSVYAVTITSKLCKHRKSLLRQRLTMREQRNRALFNALDCIIVNNSRMRTLMQEMGVTNRIEVIPNGVDLQRFRPAENGQESIKIRQTLGIGPADLVVTTVGAVMPRKGSDLLLKAWTRVLQTMPGVHLVFVGPRKDLHDPGLADYRAFLERLIVDAGAPAQVHFTGLVDSVEAYLHATDVFVLPSQREGMPNSVLEAMACGLPVVITPFIGLSDDLGTPGEHYLLAEHTTDSLAGELRRLLQDSGLRQRLGNAALQWVRQTMDLEASLDQYASLYKELARKYK
jgi:glycosyltransferase involved in cell wall biosynthesis